MKMVAPSERFRAELDDILAGVGQEQDPGVASALSTKTKQEVRPDGNESNPE